MGAKRKKERGGEKELKKKENKEIKIKTIKIEK